MKILICLSIVASGIPGLLSAQSRGTITERRLIIERSEAPPETSITRTYTLGKRVRSEMQSGKRRAGLFGNDSGGVEIIVTSDSGLTIYNLNPAAKTYSEFSPNGILRGAMEMVKAMGSEMKMKMSGDSVGFDSLGDGGIIAGYRTIHYRLRFASRMSMSLMGDSMSMSMSDTADTYVAPSLKDSRDSTAEGQTLDEMKRSFNAFIPFDIGDMMARVSEVAGRIAKAGVTLKTVNSITSVAMGRRSTQRVITEVLKFERAVLPESLFQVPADYKKVDVMFRFHPDSTRN